MIQTCLLGIGKTGTVIAQELINSPEFDLAAVFVRPGSHKANKSLTDIMECRETIPILDTNALKSVVEAKRIQVAIDFTAPEAAMQNCRTLAQQGVHLVVGTTGFNNMQLYELKQLVHEYRIGLVYAPNLSVGINILLSLAKTITRLIPQYDVEILETCHRDKKDSPSGTALKLANEILATKGLSQGNRLKHGRKGHAPRESNEIGVHSLRAGGNVGEHRVLFAGASDEIEIIHRSYSRNIFAEGALKAASFVANLKGFFHMEDVLLVEKMDRDMRLAANRLYLNFNYK